MINLIETICDKCFEILIICLGIALIIFFINIGESISNYDEEECVEFYKKNNYVLESCEIYTDKLVNSNE